MEHMVKLLSQVDALQQLVSLPVLSMWFSLSPWPRDTIPCLPPCTVICALRQGRLSFCTGRLNRLKLYTTFWGKSWEKFKISKQAWQWYSHLLIFTKAWILEPKATPRTFCLRCTITFSPQRQGPPGLAPLFFFLCVVARTHINIPKMECSFKIVPGSLFTICLF